MEEPRVGTPKRTLVDFLVILLCCGVVVGFAAWYKPMDVLLNGRTPARGVSEAILAAAVILPVGLAIFARRRLVELRAVRQDLVRYSVHDVLTGLPNRRLLNEWFRADIEESKAHNGQAGVLFVDLDRFKQVNDTHGHEIGDRLMVAVAHRLEELAAGTGRVLRYGGDEFVIIAPDLNPVSARRLAELVIRMIERPFTVGNSSLTISACVGVALVEKHSVNVEDVIHDADLAMFRAKEGGRGKVVVFDRSMTGSLTPAAAERRIKRALDDGDFQLFYQPVVDLSSGRIVGAEALLRWVDPEKGTMPPAEFIPILEETGLIVPVGTWVLREACRQIAVITQLLPDVEPMTITVNVSPRQIAQIDFEDTVVAAVDAAEIDASQVHLEITEVALLDDVGSAWAALRKVKAQGVKLALDDFGTGYSSLSYVRRFSLDMLKIDKSFVDGLASSPEDRAIVEHVIGMAHALGMATVAEGIEDREQVDLLRGLGCRLGQGYVFSRPIPARDFERLLVERASSPFAVDPTTACENLPVTDPWEHVADRSDRRSSIVDLSPPMTKTPRALRVRERPTSEPDVESLVVPPGLLEASDDRRATVTPMLMAQKPADGIDQNSTRTAEPQGGSALPDPTDSIDVRRGRAGRPALPRLREYRPSDDF
ncbi:MAG: bifunctional diguanylate cyclase/phosphodiesterase [Acidimicrobiales bacterium]|nr:bifunctional diguanylate cyclase/phosphodiesterase [Acidimicrobiales bacterium]